MKKLIAFLLFAIPLTAQNFTSYSSQPVIRPSWLRSLTTTKGNILTDSSLVGWWPMTSATGNIASDMSGNGHDGTWTGTKAGTNGYWGAGKVGPWSGNFNGSNDIVTINGSFISGASKRTMMAWILPLRSDSATTLYALSWGTEVSAHRSSIGQWHTYIGFFGYAADLSVSAAPYIGNWTHITAAYDGSILTLYINGSQIGQSTIALNTTSTSYGYIGGVNGGVGNNYGFGRISDVRLYSRVLSQGEIQAIYNAGNHY